MAANPCLSRGCSTPISFFMAVRKERGGIKYCFVFLTEGNGGGGIIKISL